MRRFRSHLRAGQFGGGGYIISPGKGSPVLLFSRAQVSSFSTATGADGTTYSEFSANTPRFAGTQRRLMIEGQRTNLFANPRTVGGTGWTLTGVTAATTTGPDGVADSACLATETAATSQHMVVSVSAALTAIPYALSAWLRPLNGARYVQWSGTSGVWGGYVNFDLSGSGSVTATSSATGAIEKIGDWYRCSALFTPTAGSNTTRLAFINTSTATRQPSFAGSGTAQLGVWGPQLEAGTFASSLSLPPVGSPASTTRGADLASVSLSSLGIPDGGPGTILWSGLMQQPAPTSTSQAIIQIDDGSDNNLFAIYNRLGQNSYPRRVTGGVLQESGAGLDTMNATATTARFGMTFDASGNMSAYAIASGTALNVRSVTGGPTSGLTTLRIGNNFANTAPQFGECKYLQALPYAVSTSDLQTLVGAFPT